MLAIQLLGSKMKDVGKSSTHRAIFTEFSGLVLGPTSHATEIGCTSTTVLTTQKQHDPDLPTPSIESSTYIPPEDFIPEEILVWGLIDTVLKSLAYY